jgi:hypothetical protein
VGAEEGEAGSEVPRRRHPGSLARFATVESETLGCGWEEIGVEEAGEMVLRGVRGKRGTRGEAMRIPRGLEPARPGQTLGSRERPRMHKLIDDFTSCACTLAITCSPSRKIFGLFPSARLGFFTLF